MQFELPDECTMRQWGDRIWWMPVLRQFEVRCSASANVSMQFELPDECAMQEWNFAGRIGWMPLVLPRQVQRLMSVNRMNQINHFIRKDRIETSRAVRRTDNEMLRVSRM